MGRYVLLAAAGALLAAAAAVNHSAAQAVTGAPISFPPVALNGADQVVDGSTSAWRVDAAGEVNGWNVTVSSTDFTNGNGNAIAVSNFEVRLQDAQIAWISGDTTVPVSTQPEFAALSETGRKIVSAAVGEASGVYDLTPDFRLTVPAETYAGVYTATVTVAINTGP